VRDTMAKLALIPRLIVLAVLICMLTSCTTANQVNALDNVGSRQKASVSSSANRLTGSASQTPVRVGTRTYLINGLGSHLEEIAFGFENLSKKIPGAKLYNYSTITAGSTVIRNRIERDIRAAHKRDPNVRINLIGHSLGANIATIIAASLERDDIEVDYLATVDGPAMVPLYANVKAADNFTCTDPTCFKTSSKLYYRNEQTKHRNFRLDAKHLTLSNHRKVHERIIQKVKRI